MKKLGLIILVGLSQAFPSVAQQQQVTLDLQQTIKMANDSSLEAFRTKNMAHSNRQVWNADIRMFSRMKEYWVWSKVVTANRQIPSICLLCVMQ